MRSKARFIRVLGEVAVGTILSDGSYRDPGAGILGRDRVAVGIESHAELTGDPDLTDRCNMEGIG